MDANIRIGILTESLPMTTALGRALEGEPGLEVRALDPDGNDPETLADADVLVVSASLPRGGALRLLGRSWLTHRFPRLVFVHAEDPPGGEGIGLTRGCAAELVDLARAVARGRGSVPPRVALRFLEAERGGDDREAVALG